MRSLRTARKSSPRLPQLEKAAHSNEDPSQPKKSSLPASLLMKTISFHVFIFSPQLLFRAHCSMCTLKSLYKCLPSCTDGIAAPSIWFSANAHTDKKSLKMKSEESTYQKLQLACIPCAFPLFRTVLALGGISKMGLLKPQIRMGSFEISPFAKLHNVA